MKSIGDDTSKKINIKTAIYLTASAWKSVTSHTIENCWLKTGILPAPIQASITQRRIPSHEVSDDPLVELASLLQNMSSTMDPNEYASIDDTEPTDESSIVRDQQALCKLVLEEAGVNVEPTGQDDEKSDEEDEEIEPIGVEDAMRSVDLLISFFEQLPNEQSKVIERLCAVKNVINSCVPIVATTQTTLLNFLRSN